MIQVKSLYKSFEGKDVLVDINATFNNGKNQSDYRSERFREDGINEVYRRFADSRKRRDSV